MIQDPKTGKASVTLTMFIVSFTIAIIGLIGKVSNITGTITYSDIMWLYGLSGSFYLGRKMTGNGKSMEIGAAPKDDVDSPPNPQYSAFEALVSERIYMENNKKSPELKAQEEIAGSLKVLVFLAVFFAGLFILGVL